MDHWSAAVDDGPRAAGVYAAYGELIGNIRSPPKPVVAALNGTAAGQAQ